MTFAALGLLFGLWRRLLLGLPFGLAVRAGLFLFGVLQDLALGAAGFCIQRRKHSEEQILYDDAKAFLKAIHEQGVTGGKVSVGTAPLTRTELGQPVPDYQENSAPAGGVSATYETATFLLQKN